MCVDRNPLHCIIPPYMLEKLAASSRPRDLRECALRSLRISRHFQSTRRSAQRAFKALGFESLPGAARAPTAGLTRMVYDAGGLEVLPGRLVRSEGTRAVKDRAVNQVYNGAGHTDALFRGEFGRNSIDDHGMPIVQTVHFGLNYQNAFWDGAQMVYGDGDGQVFGSFTADLDIIAHELSHGVTQHEAALSYQFQSGALNEHFSDVFGSLVRQRLAGEEADAADWLIGASVLVGKAFALRSMKAPGTAYVDHPILGTDPQPATMDGFRQLPLWEDRGGVHINSGIPNHAFYRAAVAIGGGAWKKAGLVWYRALCNLLTPDATFARAAQATIQVARNEFGGGSLEEKAVAAAWKSVKVI